ncbi:MAG: hypothetical protein ACI85O_001079 [Saprospiraceae bacterium]|jgi:hypothetical protein
MKVLSKLFRLSLVAAVAIFAMNIATAQCVNWTTLAPAEMEKAENAHVVYRQFAKSENYKEAFKDWKIAYDLAPAADGQRPFHYTDGRKIYMDLFNKETDEAKKKEHAAIVLRLYDEEMECYGTEGKAAFLQGRKAFDMFYYLRIPYSKVLANLNKALELGGNDTEYVVLDPYARVVVHQFTNELMDKETARAAHTKLNAIADHNIANNEKPQAEYQQAKESMNGVFASIENFIFDCEYFYERLVPEYKANPDDRDTYLNVYTTLVKRGCDKEDPVLVEIAAKDRIYQMEELRKNNKGYAARELYDAGDFNGAIAKYKEAIAEEADPIKQSEMYFAVASIQFRKLKSYGPARESARKAASLNSGYGKPYELIGDMYATGARNCGSKSWDHSLAVLAAIEKYKRAKAIDPSLAATINKKINNYSGSKPSKEDGFMMKVKEGSSIKVPCWIGEKVTVRY